jgi:hypothetical protein
LWRRVPVRVQLFLLDISSNFFFFQIYMVYLASVLVYHTSFHLFGSEQIHLASVLVYHVLLFSGLHAVLLF